MKVGIFVLSVVMIDLDLIKTIYFANMIYEVKGETETWR